VHFGALAREVSINPLRTSYLKRDSGHSSLATFPLKSRLTAGGNGMKHWQRQPRSTLCLAALLSLLLVQSAFGFPFLQHANLSPRMLSHNLGSFVSAVLTGSRHVADDLELLYQLRQMAVGASQPEKPSVPASLGSPLPSAQKTVCAYRGRQPATADR
jgi:hypothetical protein